jgi:hypothetical protein
MDIYLISGSEIPNLLHGAHNRIVLRYLTDAEKIALEDKLFETGTPLELPSSLHVLIIPDISQRKGTERPTDYYLNLAEFSLSVLSVAGRTKFSIFAFFSNHQFTFCELISPLFSDRKPLTFRSSITGITVAQWIYICMKAFKNIGIERMHITTTRYLRALDTNQIGDSLLDLTISLESILDARTEISFRFGICLSRVAGLRGNDAENAAKLLSTLYDVRSKITHGDPAVAKALDKLGASIPEIHRLARKILVVYMLFVSEHTLADWRNHLHTKLFE